MDSDLQFHVLNARPKGRDEEYRTDFFYNESVTRREAPRCDACGKYLGMLRAVPPLHVSLETWGVDFGDVAFQMGDEFLVSARFKVEYEKEGLSGLDGFDPVEIVSVRHHYRTSSNPPDYFRVLVSRSETAIDPNASGVIWDVPPTCDRCALGKVLRRWNQVVVEAASWDGADIFVARGLPGTIIVSNRFAKWSQRFGMRNVVFISARQVGHDFDNHLT